MPVLGRNVVRHRVGPAQFVVSSEALSPKELEVLTNYLLKDYSAIRKDLLRKGLGNKTREVVADIFVKSWTVTQKMTVYRSQTQPFDVRMGSESIISTVKEPERCAGFGSFTYAFVLSPGVKYITVEWNINDGNGPFTEIILPFDGHFRKVRKPAATLQQYEGVYRFNERDHFSPSPSSPSPSSNNALIQRMGLALLDEFRLLPAREQTKAKLLEMLNASYNENYSIHSYNSLPFEWATAEKKVMNSLLRREKENKGASR